MEIHISSSLPSAKQHMPPWLWSLRTSTPLVLHQMSSISTNTCQTHSSWLNKDVDTAQHGCVRAPQQLGTLFLDDYFSATLPFHFLRKVEERRKDEKSWTSSDTICSKG